MRFGKEMVRIVGYMQFLRELLRTAAGYTCRCKNHHICLNFNLLTAKKCIDTFDNQFTILFIYSGYPAADIINCILLYSPANELFVIFPACADVHIKYS